MSEEAAFKRAIKAMGDVYASAIGTTVLQLKEIPERPPEYDGFICLYNLAEGIDAAAIRAALEPFGEIVHVGVGGWPPARVRPDRVP